MVTLAFANIYIRIGSTVVGALACHDRGSWFETSNLTAFSLFPFLFGSFNLQTNLRKLKFTGLAITSRLVKKLFKVFIIITRRIV